MHEIYKKTQQLKVTYLYIHPLYCIYRVITKVAYLYIRHYLVECMLMDTTNGKYILSKTKKCLLSVASNLLLA